MKCNCMWTEVVLAVLILVFTIWPTLIFSATVSYWIVVVSAAILLIHAVKVHPEHYSSKRTSSARSRSRSSKKRRR